VDKEKVSITLTGKNMAQIRGQIVRMAKNILIGNLELDQSHLPVEIEPDTEYELVVVQK